MFLVKVFLVWYVYAVLCRLIKAPLRRIVLFQVVNIMITVMLSSSFAHKTQFLSWFILIDWEWLIFFLFFFFLIIMAWRFFFLICVSLNLIVFVKLPLDGVMEIDFICSAKIHYEP